VPGNLISLRQIPEKIYIFVTHPASKRPSGTSNGLNFPITNIKVDFNNRSNLLAELDQRDLYTLSRKNGSYQPFSEFSGTLRDGNTKEYISLGSIVVLDPVRDLSLDDYLTSGSLGSFSLQMVVTCENYANASAVVAKTSELAVELNVVASYGGVLITQQGSSALMSGLLTKALVLDTKDKGTAIGDYEEVAQLTGGNIGRSLTGYGDVMKKKGKNILNKKISQATDGVGGKYNISGGSKLSKYI
jgi:hypothetical protein